jgi:hypothetical protein
MSGSMFQFAPESGLRFAINEDAGLCIFQLPFPLLRRRTATAQGRQPAPRLSMAAIVIVAVARLAAEDSAPGLVPAPPG